MSEAPEILFDEPDHRYTVDGRVRPSVTTILQDLGFIDFSAVPYAVLERAKFRGKSIHQAIHYLQENDLDMTTVDEEIKPYLEAFGLFTADTGWQAERIEDRVFCEPLDYAGTLDGVGSMLALQIPKALIDLKSGIETRAAAYQTAAYAIAIGEPYIPRFSVHLKKTGRYKLVHHKNYNDIQDWKSIAHCYHLKHRED